MFENLINFLFGFINEMAKFGDWLVTPLEHINMAPLALFSFAGITLIIGFLIVRLVIGG